MSHITIAKVAAVAALLVLTVPTVAVVVSDDSDAAETSGTVDFESMFAVSYLHMRLSADIPSNVYNSTHYVRYSDVKYTMPDDLHFYEWININNVRSPSDLGTELDSKDLMHGQYYYVVLDNPDKPASYSYEYTKTTVTYIMDEEGNHVDNKEKKQTLKNTVQIDMDQVSTAGRSYESMYWSSVPREIVYVNATAGSRISVDVGISGKSSGDAMIVLLDSDDLMNMGGLFDAGSYSSVGNYIYLLNPLAQGVIQGPTDSTQKLSTTIAESGVHGVLILPSGGSATPGTYTVTYKISGIDPSDNGAAFAITGLVVSVAAIAALFTLPVLFRRIL